MFKYIFIATMMLAGAAFAQTAPTLSFTADTVTGNGSVTPRLTWSTSPAASSCVASGDVAWAGARPASGTVTLTAVTQSKTYNLVCTWPAESTAIVSWVAPSLNTDGSPYTDPAGYTVRYGTAAAALTQTVSVNNPTTLTHTVTGLSPGSWFFCVNAVNLNNVESACSSVGTKVLVAGTVSRSVGIVVNPVPNAPSGLTVR